MWDPFLNGLFMAYKWGLLIKEPPLEPFHGHVVKISLPNFQSRPSGKWKTLDHQTIAGNALFFLTWLTLHKQHPSVKIIEIWMFPTNGGTPKSSILIGLSIINHPILVVPPFKETSIFGLIHGWTFNPLGVLFQAGLFFWSLPTICFWIKPGSEARGTPSRIPQKNSGTLAKQVAHSPSWQPFGRKSQRWESCSYRTYTLEN